MFEALGIKMRYLPKSPHNLITFISVIFISLFLVFIIGPQDYLDETVQATKNSQEIRNFPNMKACIEGCQSLCGCSKKKNPLFLPYNFGVVPIIVATFGFMFFTGRVSKKLVLQWREHEK